MCPRAAERAKRVKYDLMAVVVVYIEDGQRVAFYGHVLSDASGNPPQGKFGLCVRFGWSRRTWIAGAVDAMDDGDALRYLIIKNVVMVGASVHVGWPPHGSLAIGTSY